MLLDLDSNPLYHYVIARADLPRGVQAAQIVHGAGLSVTAVPLPIGTHAVVLTVPDEISLLALSETLSAQGFWHVLVREPDPPYHDAAMAIGLEPQFRTERLKSVLSALPLLK